MGRRGRDRGHEFQALESQGCDLRRTACWVGAAFEGVGAGIESRLFALGAFVVCVCARDVAGLVDDVAGEFEVDELFEIGVEAVDMQS